MIDPNLPPHLRKLNEATPTLRQPIIRAGVAPLSRALPPVAQPINDHHTHHSRPDAELERAAGDAALGEDQSKERATGRVHIRFVSVRKRLLDPDNLSEKWLLDCLRNCGAIDGDEPDKITLETTQRKTAKGEEEFTQITITYP